MIHWNKERLNYLSFVTESTFTLVQYAAMHFSAALPILGYYIFTGSVAFSDFISSIILNYFGKYGIFVKERNG